MSKIKKILTILVLLASISIVPATATPIDDISNVFQNIKLPTLTWFLPGNQIQVTDTGINYYVSISGNSWRADLTDDSGKLIASQSGVSYGTHTFSRPPGGQYYRITVYCFYSSSTCAGEGGERFYVPSLTSASPTPAPAVTTPALTSSPVSTQTPTPTPTPQPTATTSTAPAITSTDIQIIPTTVSEVTGIKQSPGFEAIYPIIGLLITAKLVLRGKR